MSQSIIRTNLRDISFATGGSGQVAARGIETLSRGLATGEAAIQVLMLPVLILGWGLAVAGIVAFT